MCDAGRTLEGKITWYGGQQRNGPEAIGEVKFGKEKKGVPSADDDLSTSRCDQSTEAGW